RISANFGQIGYPVARSLDERSTLESSGSGVWAGRPRPCYRSSSLWGLFRAPRRCAGNCRWSPVAFLVPGAAPGRASFSVTRHVARSLSAPGAVVHDAQRGENTMPDHSTQATEHAQAAVLLRRRRLVDAPALTPDVRRSAWQWLRHPLTIQQ